MKVLFLFALLVSPTLCSLAYCGPNGTISLARTALPGLVLQKVLILARHGARITAVQASLLPKVVRDQGVEWNCVLQDEITDSILQTMPLLRKHYMINRNAVPGNCSLGQLTITGANQHAQLGLALRRAYGGFLPSLASQVYVRSTDVERTFLSARHILGAAFPANSSFVVNTMDPFMDNAFPNPQICPALGTAMATVMSSKPFLDFYNAKLGATVAKYSSLWNVSLSLDDILYLNDELRSRICSGLPLPPNMNFSDAELIITVVSQLTNMQYSPQNIVQLSVSGFLQDLSVVFNDANIRFTLFAIHDATLRSLLLAVQDFDGHWPAFASHLVLERYQNSTNNEEVVVLSFDGQVLQMSAPCTSKYCLLADFESLISQSVIPPSACN